MTRSTALYASTFVLCLSSLVFQISIIRIFSAIFRYHFVFAVVSFSILGLGLGALLARWRNGDAYIVAASIAAAILNVTPMIMIFTTPALSLLPPLAAVSIVLIPAFIFSGWCVGSIFTRWPDRAGKLYAADLIGAGTGCFVGIFLLNLLGPVSTISATATLTSLAGLIFALGCERERRLRAATFLALPLLIACFAFSVSVPLNRLTVGRVAVDPANSKPMIVRMQRDPNNWTVLATRWDAYARTDAVMGLNKDLISIFTDGDTPAPMVRMHSRETDPTALRSHIGHVPLDVWRPRQSDRMLTIGAGGGLDVLFGQFAGVRDITAIDINPALPAMLEQFREFYGDLYNKPGTKLFIQEGRHFLARDTGAYDLIYLSLTQTATATGQGLALAESYIQTREGLQDAVARLTPSGALVLIFDQDAFLARAFVTALSILYSEGQSIAKAAAHLAVVSAPNKNNAPYNHLLIIKRSPLTAEETARLKFVTEARGFALSYLAPDTGSPLLKQLASSSEAYKLPEVNLRPVSDDSPFFFDLSFELPIMVRGLLVISASVTFIVLVWAFASGRNFREATPKLSILAILVALIGVGFMVVQNIIVQRYMLFLGFPTITLSVVLFSMLVGAGLGSLLSHFFINREKWQILLVTCMFSVPAVLMVNYLGPLVTSKFFYLSTGGRIILTGAMIFPLSISLGCFFPTALRLAGHKAHSIDIPILWAINGSASVLGSALSVALSKQFSFTFALNIAASCYLGALLLMLWSCRRT